MMYSKKVLLVVLVACSLGSLFSMERRSGGRDILLGAGLEEGSFLVSDDPEELLRIFAGNGNLEAVRALVEWGTDVNSRGASDFQSRSPLHQAVRSLRIDVVKFLLSCKGININVVDDENQTVLHYLFDKKFLSFDEESREIVELLLERGIDWTSRSDLNVTFYGVASLNKHEKFCGLIEETLSLSAGELSLGKRLEDIEKDKMCYEDVFKALKESDFDLFRSSKRGDFVVVPQVERFLED